MTHPKLTEITVAVPEVGDLDSSLRILRGPYQQILRVFLRDDKLVFLVVEDDTLAEDHQRSMDYYEGKAKEYPGLLEEYQAKLVDFEGKMETWLEEKRLWTSDGENHPYPGVAPTKPTEPKEPEKPEPLGVRFAMVKLGVEDSSLVARNMVLAGVAGDLHFLVPMPEGGGGLFGFMNPLL